MFKPQAIRLHNIDTDFISAQESHKICFRERNWRLTARFLPAEKSVEVQKDVENEGVKSPIIVSFKTTEVKTTSGCLV